MLPSLSAAQFYRRESGASYGPQKYSRSAYIDIGKDSACRAHSVTTEAHV